MLLLFLLYDVFKAWMVPSTRIHFVEILFHTYSALPLASRLYEQRSRLLDFSLPKKYMYHRHHLQSLVNPCGCGQKGLGLLWSEEKVCYSSSSMILLSSSGLIVFMKKIFFLFLFWGGWEILGTLFFLYLMFTTCTHCVFLFFFFWKLY